MSEVQRKNRVVLAKAEKTQEIFIGKLHSNERTQQ
jgi:hypothetical protein